MPLNLYINNGHDKLGGHISKNVAKIATNWLKISRAATFGHLAIFYPILTFRFWFFEPLFATCGHIGRADPKVPPGCRYLPCLSPQTHCSKSMSQKNRSPSPPPPPPLNMRDLGREVNDFAVECQTCRDVLLVSCVPT